MIVPAITIDFIGTVSSNPGHRAYGLPRIMAISVGTMTFEALTMPAVEISEFPRHRHDGGFFSSTCLHSQIPYDIG